MRFVKGCISNKNPGYLHEYLFVPSSSFGLD